ncbi:enoyl-CoA hydratase/isomerase family protein [Microbacterium sp. A84]|uniref:enoyl-CoA hydratase/isomerase family protein n=1 Tax=Microbacterium sp. A84 TaxID=3450715 RepID=UPI003F41DC5A
MNGEVIEVRREGAVGWLVLNRPHAGNAMDAAMMSALPRAWRELDADPSVRCIVVTGAGKSFQTGLDVAALANEPETLKDSSRRTRNARLQLTGWHLGVRTPVITAVNGMCAGGGLHFVVDSDIVIASTSAKFVDPHVSVGQASAWEAIGLMLRMPASRAARVALMGAHERMSAAEALRWGLVSEVVEPDDLVPRAQELAEHIASRPPEEVRAAKAALWAALENDRTSSLRWAELNRPPVEETP